MSTTYHCDRCGQEVSEESGRTVRVLKHAVSACPESSAPLSSAQKDLCSACVDLLAAFLEPIPA